MMVAHVACDACRTIGKEQVDKLLADVLVAASKLPSSSTAPGGEAGPQAAHEAARAAARSADDGRPEGSTPPGASMRIWHAMA